MPAILGDPRAVSRVDKMFVIDPTNCPWVSEDANWPAPNEWVFITKLVEHCSANAGAMGSNPFDIPNFFSGLFAITRTATIAVYIFNLPRFHHRNLATATCSYAPIPFYTGMKFMSRKPRNLLVHEHQNRFKENGGMRWIPSQFLVNDDLLKLANGVFA